MPIGDVMGEAHKNVQHVTFGKPGDVIRPIGRMGESLGKAAKGYQKTQKKKQKKAQDDFRNSDEYKAQEKKVGTALRAEVTRHVRRLNSPNAGDRATVEQSHRLIDKFGSSQEYRRVIALHPEFKRHLSTVLSNTQFPAK